MPARIIAVGNDRPLHKALRQSQLFDAIVKAIEHKHPQSVPVEPIARSWEDTLVLEHGLGRRSAHVERA